MKEYSLFGIKPDIFYDDNYNRELGSELKKQLPTPEVFIDEIKNNLINAGFEILNEKMYITSKEIAGSHYKEHYLVFTDGYNESKYDFLVRYMTSNKSYWIIFYGENAISEGRKILKQIREKFLKTPQNARYNMTHASDNADGAIEEIKLHFPDFIFTK